MANRFCTNCGAPLEPGSKFCVACGHPVEDGASPVGQESDPTQYVPPTYAQPYDSSVGQARAKSKDSLSTGAIVTIVVVGVAVAAVVATAAWGAMGNRLPWQHEEALVADDSGSSGDSDSGSSQDASASDAADSSDSGDSEQDALEEQRKKEEQADKQFRSQLQIYYNDLSGYDSRIRSVASEFNGGYASGDYASRQAAAQTCYNLQSEIQSEVSSFAALSVPDNSAYSNQYGAIARCLNDHLARVSCIASAWQIDLTYDDPSAHTDEICAPIAAQNVDGKNRALLDYESVYPTIDL